MKVERHVAGDWCGAAFKLAFTNETDKNQIMPTQIERCTLPAKLHHKYASSCFVHRIS